MAKFKQRSYEFTSRLLNVNSYVRWKNKKDEESNRREVKSPVIGAFAFCCFRKKVMLYDGEIQNLYFERWNLYGKREQKI